MGTTNLTRLNVALTATTGAFSKSIESAHKTIEHFGEGLKEKLLHPITLITEALTVGEFVHGIKEAAQRIGDLAKSADLLGITTESLAGLRLAAEETGGSTEGLANAMEHLTRMTEQAAQGNKEAIKSLQALKIPLSDLVAARPDEQFRMASDALNAMGTQGQRTAAIMQIFGKGAMQTVGATLALGSRGFDEAAEKASKFGLAVSRIDAEKVKEAKTAFDEIGLVIEGVFNRIIIRLAPFITAISEAFTGASVEANGFAETVDNAMTFAVKAGGFIADAWQGLNIVWIAIKDGLYTVFTAITFVADAGVQAAQWIGAKFSASFDLVVAAFAVVKDALMTGWGGLEVAVAEFVQFAGHQFSWLIRQGLEVAGVFSNAMANKMAMAAGTIDTSVKTMADNAHAHLDTLTTSLGTSSAEVVAKTDALFADVDASGSQTLQDLGKAFWQLGKEQTEALDLALGEERASDHFNRIVKQVQDEAQVRADARVKELTDQQAAMDKEREALAGHIAQRESLWDQSWAYEQSQREKNIEMTLRGGSSMFANLAALQKSHSKTAQAIGRAAAKAKIVTDTASAAMGAYSAMASIPFVGPALGIAAAAAAVAAGAIQLGNVDKGGINTTGAGPTDVSTTNIGGIQAPATPGQTVILQGDSFSTESLMKIFSDAKERGFIIEGVRRG